MIEEESKISKWLIITLAVAIVSGIVGIIWYFQRAETGSFYTQLLEKNEEFSYAEGLLKSGEYDEATDYFKLALEKAEGYKEEGQLKYKIALSESNGSKPIDGIVLLKEVAANENYTPTIRAYSAQRIGSLLYSYNTPEIKEEVFKDDPYKGFIADGDYSLALRRLFEYASAFYPLGVSELRIAKWYSAEVLRLSIKGVSDNETRNKIDEMKSIIRQRLVNADKYLFDIAKDEQVRVYVPEVLYRKGNVLADLYLSGDKNFGDPEESYKQALSVLNISPSAEAAAKVRYAIFLARMYGKERIKDILSLLRDFYSGTKYESTGTVRSIGNEKNDILGNKDDYLLLARFDPQFAQFLRTLGWVI